MKYLIVLILTCFILIAMNCSVKGQDSSWSIHIGGSTNDHIFFAQSEKYDSGSVVYSISMHFPDSTIEIYGDTAMAIRSIFKWALDCQNKEEISEFYVSPSGAYKRDTTPPKQMDSIAIKDIYRLWDGIKDKVTARQSDDFAAILQYILVTANKEFLERQKVKKK